MHSILHRWVCILIFEGHFIEYDCWWEFVCELSEILFSLYSLCHISLRVRWVTFFLGTLSHCPFHHHIHYWCDFTPRLTWVDHHFSSYIHCFTIILVIACDSSHSLHPLVIFIHWPIPGLIFPCIILAYLIISLICFIISLLILYSHWAPSGPWFTSFSIHVAFYTWGHGFFIIGYLGLVSLHFYYLITLAYVTSRVLRPLWGYGIRSRLKQPLLI